MSAFEESPLPLWESRRQVKAAKITAIVEQPHNPEYVSLVYEGGAVTVRKRLVIRKKAQVGEYIVLYAEDSGTWFELAESFEMDWKPAEASQLRARIAELEAGMREIIDASKGPFFRSDKPRAVWIGELAEKLLHPEPQVPTATE